MKTILTQLKFVKWLSAEDMHATSKNWLLELKFIRDEQHFFEDLIRKYIFQLIAPDQFKASAKIVDSLAALNKENEKLINLIQKHENDLKIMVDGKDQLIEEEIYKVEHKRLIEIVDEFLKEYKNLKQSVFSTIKTIVKKEKKKIT
ncbi:hypothetical protein [uncultured Tenacibaculum sp.]|uniref:hypothetical protein n=1 Tax=uncultured Tenacibaculum sp. TaxID=174713 RepID=UPI0026189D13|nr:hypothetical protein [uncultured Tenacibaculum sp.]